MKLALLQVPEHVLQDVRLHPLPRLVIEPRCDFQPLDIVVLARQLVENLHLQRQYQQRPRQQERGSLRESRSILRLDPCRRSDDHGGPLAPPHRCPPQPSSGH